MENQPPFQQQVADIKIDPEEVIKPDSQYSVDVSIEPNHECEIIEVKYDGQEIYKEPLTHSDYLAQLISKIDFYSENNDTVEKKDDSINRDELTNARKFFQNLHETIKLSYDEVCVLLDCLSIARADKLMTLETDRKHMLSSNKEDEQRPFDVSEKTLSLILKKKNIEKSKFLLKKFTEKISKQENEFNSNRFHMELYRARQIWRIRKVGTKFNCDLSYRSGMFRKTTSSTAQPRTIEVDSSRTRLDAVSSRTRFKIKSDTAIIKEWSRNLEKEREARRVREREEAVRRKEEEEKKRNIELEKQLELEKQRKEKEVKEDEEKKEKLNWKKNGPEILKKKEKQGEYVKEKRQSEEKKRKKKNVISNLKN